MKRFTQLAGVVALVLSAAAVNAQTKLALGHGAALDNPRHLASVAFAKRVAELTNNEIQIQVAGSAQLGDDQALLTGNRTGSIQMSANSQGQVSSVVPEINAIGMPFLFDSPAHAWKVIDDPKVFDILKSRFDAKGLILLGLMDNGVRHVTNNKRPVNTAADLKGMKLRTPADPVTVDIFQGLGAETQQIKFSELYIALQQGVVDGQENPLVNIAASKLHEVQKFLTMTGHKYETNPLIMSKTAWGKLTEPQQQAMLTAAREAVALQRKMMGEAEVKAEADIRAAGVQVNKADTASLRAATAPVLEKWRNGAIAPMVKQIEASAQAAR
jgi:tripartite ATP-independent transporter DctP family solute receptor